MKNEVALSGTIFPSNLVDLDSRKYSSWFEKAIFKLGPKLSPKVKSIKGCFNGSLGWIYIRIGSGSEKLMIDYETRRDSSCVKIDKI